MIGASMAVRPPKTRGLAQMAIDAIRRADGTVLAAGAATPVLGPNLVTNGDFSNGTTGWSGATYPATLAVTGGEFVVTRSAVNGRASFSFPTTVGKQYLVSGWIKKIAGTTSADLGFANNDYGGSITLVGSTSASSLTYVTGIVTAVMTTSSVAVGGNGGAAGDQFGADNIIVSEILGYTYGNQPVRNYFDSAGTDILDSVTQVDQPVGLVLDGAGSVGDEKCPNGTFDSGATDWIAPAGWVIGSGVVTATATSASFRQASTPLTPGKTYQVEFDYTHTSGTLYVRVGAGPDTTFNSSGRKSAVLKATTSAGVEFYGGAVTGVIDNISVKELTGNHATQATVGSKPTLRRGLVNQLLWSGDFSNAAWTKLRLSVSGQKLIPDGTNSTHILQQAHTSAATTTYSVDAKADGYNWIALWSDSAQAGAYFNVSTGAVGTTSSGVTATIQALDDGFFRCVVSRTVAATTWQFFVATSDNVASFAGNGTSGVLVRGTALFQGTVTAQQIQAAGGIPLTTTAPASSSLGNYWWQFDPAAPGDFLQTAITTGNEGWVCAGVRQTAATTCYPVASGGLIDSMAGMNLRLINGVTPQILVCDGTLRQVLQADANVTLGAPFVYSGGWNGADLLLGVDNTEKAVARTRNPTSTTVTTIGAADNTGAGVVNGALSMVVRCPTLPSPADRALIRAWVAKQQWQVL